MERRRKVTREGAEVEVGSEFVARDGDTLTVSYPEVKLPLRAKFAIVDVGGVSYTRALRDGDDVGAEYDRIYSFLRQRAERDAVEKVRMWNAEFGDGGSK
jgi:hypothetical protein